MDGVDGVDGVVVAVDPASLEELSGRLRAAGREIDALREHPAAVRARAGDTGDPGLARATVDVATAWGWGLELLGGELRRWDALLGLATAAYQGSDRAVAASLR
ncbi:MAG: hypothetical protein ACTHN8_17390 [Angustibacter sp.]